MHGKKRKKMRENEHKISEMNRKNENFFSILQVDV